MSLNDILLVVAALLPAAALCFYVFKKDRTEKEPFGLLLLLLILGAAICLPAVFGEVVIIESIQGFFGESIRVVADEAVEFSNNFTYVAYNIAENFIGIAFVEEGLKFLVLYFVTRKNKNFNCLFDGLIYSVFVSLGFAALENVLYVTEYGFEVAILRALLSVPGHMFFAVLMGYYYSMWNLYSKANALERSYKANGFIHPSAPEFTYKKYLLLSLLIPVLAHGFYDFCCSVDYSLATVGLYAFVIFLYVHCFRKISKMSRMDGDNNTLAFGIVVKKYPHLVEYFNNNSTGAC